jgi:putative ubiquitin-RnfH superfamily antitoxin RatB of RatAB toxin-antitoxin module
VATKDDISIELAFATPARQELLKLIVPAQTTVAEVIERSGIATRFADEKIVQMQAGIWGRPVDRQHRLENGDRVELYRPLAIDPREARRLRAKP